VTTSPIWLWQVGEVEITRVREFESALFHPAVIYPDSSLEIIARHLAWLEPKLMDPASGLLVFVFHNTVIKTPSATILVDTCSGNDKERPHKLRYHRKNWPYIDNLAAAGFAPEQIDYVLCTHLHADHVSWNTRLVATDGYRRSQTPAICSHAGNGSTGGSLICDPNTLPIRITRTACYRSWRVTKAELVATDDAFDDSVSIEPWPGDTPGHVCVVIRSRGASAILSGDIMHPALQCRIGTVLRNGAWP
jgi:glyoxylase-like metal-dependent hydrolase (beta-lactamase superfamily II)